MSKITFKNKYEEMKRKEEFFTEPDKEEITDQSQECRGSIIEMAKRFGIEAIMAKAEKMTIENQSLLDKLYGNDFTKMYSNKEDMLNVRKRLVNLFDNIPARMRKEVFNDSIGEFINAYTSNDETKLEKLNTLGIVSTSQLESVKEWNKQKRIELEEQKTKTNFIKALNEKKAGLYENYKKTGNIDINNIENNATNNTNV